MQSLSILQAQLRQRSDLLCAGTLGTPSSNLSANGAWLNTVVGILDLHLRGAGSARARPPPRPSDRKWLAQVATMDPGRNPPAPAGLEIAQSKPGGSPRLKMRRHQLPLGGDFRSSEKEAETSAFLSAPTQRAPDASANQILCSSSRPISASAPELRGRSKIPELTRA